MKLKYENNCQPILNFFLQTLFEQHTWHTKCQQFLRFSSYGNQQIFFSLFSFHKKLLTPRRNLLHKKLKLKSCQISVQLQKVFSINGDRKYKKYFINSWLVSIVQPFQTGNLFRHQYQLDTRYQRVFENNFVIHSFLVLFTNGSTFFKLSRV